VTFAKRTEDFSKGAGAFQTMAEALQKKLKGNVRKLRKQATMLNSRLSKQESSSTKSLFQKMRYYRH
jgi:hypothetical protein